MQLRQRIDVVVHHGYACGTVQLVQILCAACALHQDRVTFGGHPDESRNPYPRVSQGDVDGGLPRQAELRSGNRTVSAVDAKRPLAACRLE